MQVKVFNEELAISELKKCPKIVQEYVKLLKQHNENWKDIANKAITKLKEK